MRRRQACSVTVLILATLIAATATASEAVPTISAAVDLVILPIANNTGLSEARSLYQPLLEQALIDRGLRITTADELRPLLRLNRIRTRGFIGADDARLIAGATGASHLLIGSWDLLRHEPNPEVGLSLRVLDLESMTLIRAVSVGATGEDHVGLLDRGRISDVAELAESLVTRAVDRVLPLAPQEFPGRANLGCNRLAVIPLDNESDTEFAGDIMTNILLSRLLAAGYLVLEPGFIRELGLTRNVISRGGMDAASAVALAQSYRVCRIVTGTVSRFEPSRGAPRMTAPQLAVGLRVMNPGAGTLRLMREVEAGGDDHDGLFQTRRIHSLMELADGIAMEFQKELTEVNRRDLSLDR